MLARSLLLYINQDFNQSYLPTKPTMKLMTRVATVALAAVAATSSVKAGDTNTIATGKDVKAPVVAAAAATSPFNLIVSENYDSRYMFRGVDILAGTGVLSTTFNPIWHITANDTLSVPLWFATAVKRNAAASRYREFDVPVNYTHAFGNWTVGAGYLLYTYYNAPAFCNSPANQGVQNEANANVAYTFTNSIGTFTPSLNYFYEMGTPVGYKYGSINPGSSFLTPGFAAAIPLTFIKKDGTVTFNPNTQLNFGFRYNGNAQGQALTGLNNWQLQLPVTWQITKIFSATAYWAYSLQTAGLATGTIATGRSLGWAGASIGASF